MESDLYKLSIVKIGSSDGGFILIDAILTSKSTDSTPFKPDDIWVTQNDTSKIINGLFLSDLKVSKEKPIRLGISLAKSDLKAKVVVTLQLRSSIKLTLNLPEDILWK